MMMTSLTKVWSADEDNNNNNNMVVWQVIRANCQERRWLKPPRSSEISNLMFQVYTHTHIVHIAREEFQKLPTSKLMMWDEMRNGGCQLHRIFNIQFTTSKVFLSTFSFNKLVISNIHLSLISLFAWDTLLPLLLLLLYCRF